MQMGAFLDTDPNGPMFYKGVYHLFYQYNPLGAVFGDIMIWAHSVSYDLINWIHLNHALCPSEPYDINSCWSGFTTILPGSKPLILYTGTDAKENPVMIPPDGVKEDKFRDPTTAWQGPDGKWRVVIGSQSKTQGMGILYQTQMGLTLQSKIQVLSMYDYGKFYASKTFFDNVKNRRILWGWVNESDSIEDDIEKGWSGVQSIPRRIWLDKSGKQLVQWPVEEIETLRGKQVSIHDKKLESGSVLEVLGITASQIDHSIIESFGGGGSTCITARVYPKLATEKEARLYAFNNGTQSVVIEGLDGWSMNKADISQEESFKASYSKSEIFCEYKQEFPRMGQDDEDPEKRGSKSSSSPYKWLSNFHRDLFAGAVMGGVVHTIVAPIERTKLLLQTQDSNLAIVGSGRRKFKGMLDCIVRTAREEGLLSLWRGNGSSVLRYYPSVALNFSLKDLYRNILRNGNSHDGNFVSGTAANFIAGAAAGCTTLILIYPLDIAHTRLAADIGRTEARQFRGFYHFLTTVIKKDGIGGVYRGLPASLQGMVVHRGLYFGGFDTMKEILSKGSKPELALWQWWVVAQAVTTSAGLLSYPLDTVRRRMMMQSGLEQPMYRSTLDCWRTIYRKEGVTSFYRGAVSNMFRSTGAAAILILYDEIKKFMNWSGL
ncbi:hypothetical protein Pint_12973 [Pistacia integerrima]|uniref:Uncharacterized protein n=1 Tax=Pistacia integerrima TaxID=434235 RepID=A0ACC0Y4I2_9ROSI|nr:hypothetical protein Pint_12973 [Pistacia integerrima]